MYRGSEFYEAFEAGDIPPALSMMSPDIVWHEAETFPMQTATAILGRMQCGTAYSRAVLPSGKGLAS